MPRRLARTLSFVGQDFVDDPVDVSGDDDDDDSEDSLSPELFEDYYSSGGQADDGGDSSADRGRKRTQTRDDVRAECGGKRRRLGK